MLHGMRRCGDRAPVSGDENQTVCRYVGVCVRSGTVRLTLHVMGLDRASEKTKMGFQGLYGR